MSLCRSFETEEYAGTVTLGSGMIVARKKQNENIKFIGNISDNIDNTMDIEIQNIMYAARLKATGSKYKG